MDGFWIGMLIGVPLGYAVAIVLAALSWWCSKPIEPTENPWN